MRMIRGRRPVVALALLAVGVLVAGAPGCAGARLPEGTWVVTSAEDHELVAGVETSVTIDDGEMRIHSGCNTMQGRVSYSDGVVSAKDLSTTLMACEQELMDQDAWLADFFTAGAEVSIEEDTMTLVRGSVILTLERRA